MGELKFVLGVDLDGVVADFYGGLRPIAAEWLGVPLDSLATNVTYGIPEWHLDAVGGYEDLHRFAVTQRDLFRNLPPVEGAPAALRRLSAREIRIRIITHRLYIKHAHQLAVDQTTEWLDRYGIPYWDLCFMKNKAAVGANLYIEDAPKNVEELRRDGHRTIVFTNSTNATVRPPRANTWAEAEQLILAEKEKWRKRPQKRPKELSGQ